MKGDKLQKKMEAKEYEFKSKKTLEIGKYYQVKEFLTADGVKSHQINFNYYKGLGIVVNSALTANAAA